MQANDVRILLEKAIDRLEALENKCNEKCTELEGRIQYLEEVIEAQRTMLSTALKSKTKLN